MTSTAATDRPATAKRPKRVSRGEVLLVGVIVLPMALSITLNSYGPLTEDSAVRMAFGTVAGQTISVLSAVVAAVMTVRRRYSFAAIVSMTVIAGLITMAAIGTVGTAGDLLLTRLALIAETDQLNR